MRPGRAARGFRAAAFPAVLLAALAFLSLPSVFQGVVSGDGPEKDSAAADDPAQPGPKSKLIPSPFSATGRLVSLPAEMKTIFGAEVPPVHEAILGFRLEQQSPAPTLRYYTLLRTPLSEALFADKRFSARNLHLTGRVFPGTAILELSRFQWFTPDKQLLDVYYWCEVCSIRGVDPGPCACCQAPVELREAAAARTPGE